MHAARAGLPPSLVDAPPWFGQPIRHTSCPLQVPSVRPQVRCGVCDVRPHLGWGSVPEHHPVGRVCQLLPRFVEGALGCGMPEDQCRVGFRERRVSKIGVRATVRARSCRNLPPDSQLVLQGLHDELRAHIQCTNERKVQIRAWREKLGEGCFRVSCFRVVLGGGDDHQHEKNFF